MTDDVKTPAKDPRVLMSFKVNNMEFEVYDLEDHNIIMIAGERPKVLFHDVPGDLTKKGAELLVIGYFHGYTDGKKEVLAAVRSDVDNSFQRKYHRPKEGGT